MRILLTNDDGIGAPGLRALWHSVQGLGEVTIVAPCSQRSGVGMGVTFGRHLDVKRHTYPEDALAWTVSGTPGDCVRMAVAVALNEPPDLILSGINYGGNAGRNVFYSGTAGAAMEGALQGISSIAFSCNYSSGCDPDYAVAHPYIPRLIQFLADHPLPPSTFLNVNFPAHPQPKGVRMARQGLGYWSVKPTHAGEGRYDLTDHHTIDDEHEESDVALLEAGYVTVVPVKVGDLTHEAYLSKSFNFSG